MYVDILTQPYAFINKALQSGIFTKKAFILGFISSILTAGIAFFIRWLFLNYWDMDLLSLHDWISSLTYFSFLGGIRFVIREYLNQKLYLPMDGGNGSQPNSGAGSSSNPGVSSSSNNPGVGSSSNTLPPSFDPQCHHSYTPDEASRLRKKIVIAVDFFYYCAEQATGAQEQLTLFYSERPKREAEGNLETWDKQRPTLNKALYEWERNYDTEGRKLVNLQKQWHMGKSIVPTEPTQTKRSFSDFSEYDENNSSTSNKR